MRFCGRIGPRHGGLTQGHWGAQNENGMLGFHPNRYFMGKVAHASFFSHAMTKEQVNALMAAYVKQYNLPVTPFDLPAGIEQPVAYYALDEGAGFDLKESVSGKIDAGKVIYDTAHQTVAYDQPNWVNDEYFGTVLACGAKDTEQKDTLELADVDYGSSGAFTINVWFRHDQENFEDFDREQFFSHGDPTKNRPSSIQVHTSSSSKGIPSRQNGDDVMMMA